MVKKALISGPITLFSLRRVLSLQSLELLGLQFFEQGIHIGLNHLHVSVNLFVEPGHLLYPLFLDGDHDGLPLRLKGGMVGLFDGIMVCVNGLELLLPFSYAARDLRGSR